MVAIGEEESQGASQSRADRNGPHYLAKCVLRGSAVLHAVYGHLRSPSSHDVVFGKETSIELVVVGEDGIVQSICEQTVFGIIKDLAILTWNENFHEAVPQTQGKDLLVVLSDSGKLSFLTFCSQMHRFFAVTHIQLSKPGNSRHQLGKMLAVDTECCIAVSAYEDRFALLSLLISADSNITHEKILYPPENDGEMSNSGDSQKDNVHGTIWSMCFISKGTNDSCMEAYNPVLAVLIHRKGAASNDLILFEWNRRKHIICVISQFSEAGPLAFSISEVPGFPGFAILFRIGDLLMLDLRDPQNISCIQRMNLSLPITFNEPNTAEESCRALDVDDEGMFNVAACALLELRDSRNDMVKGDDPMVIDSRGEKVIPSSKHVCSWSWEPCKSARSRMVFCLDTGEVYIIEISSNGEGIRISSSDCLYRGLPCKTLSWVNGGFMTGLVEMGDGIVLKLENGRLVYKSPIQNIAPILDISIVDYHDEKQDQLFACCGMSPEGSIRIIRSGISVEKLLRTAPIYQGITGTWTLKMRESDFHHSFLVLSFVEETRVLSVGLSFVDVTDATGFQADACTLACGLLTDGFLVQIYRTGVKLCLPTTLGHPNGAPLSAPVCTSWNPGNMTISLGAVGSGVIVVATSNPCVLFLLGSKPISACHFEIYEVRRLALQHEVSCISIPRYDIKHECVDSEVHLSDRDEGILLDRGELSKLFVIGTHKPSVEILSFSPKEGFKLVAIGVISISNAMGVPISGCIPQDVRLVSADRSYILSGLRNGMLLRFEWPLISAVQRPEKQQQFETFCLNKSWRSSTVTAPHFLGVEMEHAENSMSVLQLIAIRRIGITPVFLVALHDSLEADVIVLSDRPWLLHTARHSLAYTSISFQPATHVTPVSSAECPKGILFVAENSLHLVEMVHCKRLNVQKFSIGGTPRKVLYHSDSKTLLVMRIGLGVTSCSSDICRIDPLCGSILSTYSFGPGEIPKCMELVKVGNEQVLVVGTSLSVGRTIMPSGEAESNAKGRFLVLRPDFASYSDSNSPIFRSNLSSSTQASSPLREIVGYAAEQLSSSSLCSSPDDATCDGAKMEEAEPGQWQVTYQQTLPGAVLSVCSYLDRYVLASAGYTLNVFGFLNDNAHRLRKFAVSKTRFTITCLTTHFTRIAVGDCRDGILFYSYQEDLRKLEQLYSDPTQRLVADCALMDMDTAIASDRKGTISVLSCMNCLEGTESPERNLMQSCSFYMGETVMTIQKGFFSYKLPVDDVLNEVFESAGNNIVASTLLGSVLILVPITSQEHELLEYVQTRLAVHPLTAPILGNDHKEFRGRGSLAGVPTMLDGDMLAQFLELTSMQQEAVLASPTQLNTKASASESYCSVPVNQVVRLLERVYHALQ